MDALTLTIRTHSWRDVSKSAPDRRQPDDDFAGLRGDRLQQRASPDLSLVSARRPARASLGRWLLDVLVVSFAYGGCIHHTHPNYVEFLRDLNRDAQR